MGRGLPVQATQPGIVAGSAPRPGPGVMGSGPVVIFSGGGTGGHLYPALALASGIQSIRPGIRPFFVGARGGLEARILPDRGLEHLLLPVRGFRRGSILGNLGVLAGLLRSLFPVGEAFLRLRPKMVVVTGGFAGGPAGLIAGLMGIPLALQEQNAQPGITSRVLSRWSRQIHLAFPEAVDLLPGKAKARARVSGNPIRSPSHLNRAEARKRLGLQPQGRVVLVVGGSQGSRALNEVVLDLVRGIEEGTFQKPSDLQLLWGTGVTHLDGIQEDLLEMGDPLWVHPWGYFDEMPVALDAADLAVSRSGAMTTSELLAWGLPSILVPLPTSAADHQARNAESLEMAGAALHLPESGLSGADLWTSLDHLLRDPSRLQAMAESALKRGRPEATQEISRALVALLPVGKGMAR